jgi:anthranilate phosphoribosyltransferase
MAQVLADRGDSALVFRGDDGLDELTTTTTSAVWIASGHAVRTASVDPARVGIAAIEAADLRGGDRVHNAAVARAVLAGDGGRVRDAVLLNAAAAIAARDGLEGDLDDAIAAGLEHARRAVDSGAAAEVLQRWVQASQAAAQPAASPAARPS